MRKHLVRSFQAVGHGAFYIERFYKNYRGNPVFTAVFDCGSMGASLINRRIDETFKPGETINVVFISHLHNDHVNGLEHLQQHCKVETVVFPYVTQSQKNFLQIDSVITGGWTAFSQRLLTNPVETISQLHDAADKTRVVFVEAEVDEQYKTTARERDKDHGTDNVHNTYRSNLTLKPTRFPRATKQGKVYKSGRCVCPLQNMPWIYVPYVINEESYTRKLEQLLGPTLFKRLPDDWVQLSQAERNRIKAHYDSLGDGINANSLTVYSGPDSAFNQMHFAMTETVEQPWIVDYSSNTVPGCLYLGDFEVCGVLPEHNIKSVFNWVWPMTGSVQIPHHGSHRNYDKSISSAPVKYSIISSRSSDPQHPSPLVTSDIKQITKEDPLHVTEFVSSLRSFTIAMST